MHRRQMVKWIGTGFCLAMAVLVFFLPIDQSFNFLFWELRISSELLVFGRSFVLSDASRPIIALLYFICGLWFFILDPNNTPIQIIPLGLAGTALILTAYAVDPIFYGALFFAFLALIYVVLLSPPGGTPTPGALRYLIFQILGMLFILFASWLASWVDLSSGEELLYRSLKILGLGFSFLLGIFPFTSWIPMVAEKNHPFLAGFVVNTYLLGVILFGTRFLTEGGWIAQGINLQGPLQAAGAIMLGVGGILAVFSRHLGRLMGAVMIAEIGKSLLAVSLFWTGFPIYFSMVIVQGLALAVWANSISHLRLVLPDLGYESVAGAARQWPGISSGFLIGYFTLAGLPFLAGFPFYWTLGTRLSLYPTWIILWFIFGTVGLMVGGIRALGALTLDSGEENVLILGDRFQQSVIYLINVVLILLGLFPQGLMRTAQVITEMILGG
jgi:hypothetical protein